MGVFTMTEFSGQMGGLSFSVYSRAGLASYLWHELARACVGCQVPHADVAVLIAGEQLVLRAGAGRGVGGWSDEAYQLCVLNHKVVSVRFPVAARRATLVAFSQTTHTHRARAEVCSIRSQPPGGCWRGLGADGGDANMGPQGVSEKAARN
jgi:hypothetical protein